MTSDPEFDETVFTGEELLAVQTELRRALGASPERFSVQALVGMLSDEIEEFRTQGYDDAAIVDIIAKITGKTVAPDRLDRYYAPPLARGRPEGSLREWDDRPFPDLRRPNAETDKQVLSPDDEGGPITNEEVIEERRTPAIVPTDGTT